MVGKTLGAGRIQMTRHIDTIVPAKVLYQSRAFSTKLSSIYFEQLNVTISHIKIGLKLNDKEVDIDQLPFNILLQLIPCSGTQLTRSSHCKDIIAEQDLMELQKKHNKLNRSKRFDTIGLKRRTVMLRVIVIDIDPKNPYIVDPGLEVSFDFTYDIQQQFKYIANPKNNKEIEAEVDRQTSGLKAQLQSLQEKLMIQNRARTVETQNVSTAQPPPSSF